MKIRTRLTIYFTLLIMVIVLVRSVIMYYSIQNYADKVFYERIRAKAVTTAQRLLYLQNVDSALLAKIDKTQADLMLNENIEVYDSSDHEIYTNNDTVTYHLTKDQFAQIRNEKELHLLQGKHKIVAFTYNLAGNKNIVVGGGEDQYGDALARQLRWTLIYLAAFSFIMVVIVGWIFAGQALAPIAIVVKKVTTLSPIEKSERLEPMSEKDEIAALVATFNDLFDKLEEAFKLQKFFVANVSHEMNNPLAKIKSQIEVSLIQNRDKEDYKKILKSVLEDVNEMIILMQDMMKFSKISKETLTYDEFRIDELLFEIRDNIIATSQLDKVDIELSNPPLNDREFIIKANKPLIATAIKNIINNACKYSPDHTAQLTLSIHEGRVIVSVTDHGPGISAEDLPYIFNIFFRSQSALSSKGFGIGLALAQRILKAHGYDIEPSSEPGRGTTFTISLYHTKKATP
jgi:signal transduction histidine kinase